MTLRKKTASPSTDYINYMSKTFGHSAGTAADPSDGVSSRRSDGESKPYADPELGAYRLKRVKSSLSDKKINKSDAAEEIYQLGLGSKGAKIPGIVAAKEIFEILGASHQSCSYLFQLIENKVVSSEELATKTKIGCTRVREDVYLFGQESSSGNIKPHYFRSSGVGSQARVDDITERVEELATFSAIAVTCPDYDPIQKAVRDAFGDLVNKGCSGVASLPHRSKSKVPEKQAAYDKDYENKMRVYRKEIENFLLSICAYDPKTENFKSVGLFKPEK